jgi:AcrR family transcriptional regulator
MPKQPRGTRKPRGNANRAADTSPGAGKSASRAKSRQARRLPAGRHGLSREDVTNSQRQRLLEAMAVVCARRTYAATTIAEVVETAGVSRATFYELFHDKEDCFVAAMDDWIRMLAAAIQPVVYAERDGSGWPGKLRDVISALLEFIAAKPEHATAAIVEALAAGDRAYDRYSAAAHLLVSQLDQGRAFMRAGPSPPSGTARAIVGGGESLIVAELGSGRGDRVPELLPDILYLALTPYVGQETALEHALASSNS